MRSSWVLAASAALALGAAPAAHASGITSTPVTGLDDPTALAAADFDGNHYADLAVADGSELVIRLNPAGTVVRVPLSGAASQLVSGDIDGDGRADLAALTPTGIDLSTRAADGTWSTTPVAQTGTGLAIADLDGDGVNDLAVRDAGVVRLLIHDPVNGTYAPSTLNTAGTGAIAAGDVDGDGRTDLAVANGTEVTLLMRDAAGDYAPATRSTPRNARATALAIGAFVVGSRGLDVAAASDVGAIVFPRPLGAYGAPRIYEGPKADAVAVMSLLDRPALAYTGQDLLWVTPNGYGPQPFRASATMSGIATGDFDADGRTDVATLAPAAGEVFLVSKLTLPETSVCAARVTRRCAVPALLYLGLSAGAASFGTFTPGVTKTYTTSLAAEVLSTASDAQLTVSDPGRLTNGAASLSTPLEVTFSKATWTGRVSRDPVTITFKQRIGAGEALRAGTYRGSVTFTLAMTTP